MSMKEKNQVLTRGFVIIVFLFFLLSCAMIPELKVNYELPPKSEIFQGREIFLAIKDSRQKDDILGDGASTELKNFPGNLTLNITRHGETGFKIGIFQLSPLIEEVFKRRLENEGITLSLNRSQAETELLIVINEFLLDLENRKWIVRMKYEARLIKDGKLLLTRRVSGESERARIFGLREANIVLGDIMTDMVNRLNIKKLFQEAGL